MNDLVIMQWNMGVFKEGDDPGQEDRVVTLLKKLISRFKPDLLALQEAPCAKVIPLVRKAGYDCSSPRKRKLTAWKMTVWGGTANEVISDSRALAIELFLQNPAGVGRKVLVCNVHLSAGNYGGPAIPIQSLKNLARKIKQYRVANPNDVAAELIIGDFNLEPHQPELRDMDILHGNRSLLFVTKRESKRQKGVIDRRHLYNPAWQLYGKDAPHGTHYLAKEELGGPWFVLDQALFSCELVSKPAKVTLVKSVSGVSLLSKSVSMPNKNVGSDHLPIVWTVTPKP